VRSGEENHVRLVVKRGEMLANARKEIGGAQKLPRRPEREEGDFKRMEISACADRTRNVGNKIAREAGQRQEDKSPKNEK